MDKSTLYVTDLDGTLMRSSGTLSAYTVSVINRLVEQGLAFTYATARSVESARTITGDLRLSLPVITRNGAVLADNQTGKHLEKALFTEEEVKLLKEMLPELPRLGFVSCFSGEKMFKTFMPGEHTPGFEKYLEYYRNDPLMKRADTVDDLFFGQPGYVTYWEEYWVEICPQNCTKAKAILKMKERYGFQKAVVFGDSVNDLPMFRAADEAYAVDNALEELKGIATGVIGRNDEDAVAHFLESRGAAAKGN